MDTGGYLPESSFTRGMLAGLGISVVFLVILATIYKTEKDIMADVEFTTPTVVVDNTASLQLQATTPIALTAPSPTVNAAPALPTFNIAPSVSGAAPAPSSQAPATNAAPSVSTAIQAPQVATSTVVPETATEIASPNIAAPALGTPVNSDATNSVSIPTLNADSVAPSNNAPAILNDVGTSTDTVVASTQSIGTPTTNIDSGTNGIVTPNPPAQGQSVSLPVSSGAFATYAQEFTHDGSKPLLSIILEVGTFEEMQGVLRLGIPVTIAVSSINPEASTLIAAYRDNQGEVLLYLESTGNHGIRAGDDVSMVTGTLDLALPNTTGVIGIVDAPGGDFSENESTVMAVLGALEPSGLAIVSSTTERKNYAEALSEMLDLPSTTITRQVDSGVGKLHIIGEMNNAVKDISEGNGSNVFGSASEDTISALLYWIQTDVAQNVTLAPVSAVISQ